MDLASEIADYLDDGGYGTVGTDIFIGQIPSDTNGIYIVRAGGSLNNYVPIEETVLDIYYVHELASTAITQMESIKRYIHRMHTTLTDNAFIYSVLVINDVQDMDRNLEYSEAYKITVTILHRATAIIS